MAGIALACKAALAVLLVAAGASKLADLSGFAATVRLFLQAGTRAVRRATAVGIAAGEIVLGAASLSSPHASWLNVAVLALCCAFVAVSAVGHARYPGRACRCFGALTVRAFNRAAVGRAALLTLAAALATLPVSAPLLRLGAGGRLGLLAGAAVIAWSAFTAAAAIGPGRDVQAGRAQ
jgi:hypothetical protein